jgi:catechol 2,3-dioxygenase-like lactoylglutathione lyase family enzyme
MFADTTTTAFGDAGRTVAQPIARTKTQSRGFTPRVYADRQDVLTRHIAHAIAHSHSIRARLVRSPRTDQAVCMQIHRGRLIDHVQLVVKDLAASKRFYETVMKVIEIPAGPAGEDYFSYDEMWISTSDSEAAQGQLTGRVHFAFAAKDRATVDAFHRAAVAAGGRDNGKPGERPYHPGYYAAFVLDPDGNNIEVVHHGPAKYSAPSITITFDD